MADPAVRAKAKELFVENGFSMATILTLLDGSVSRKTLYNWRKEDNWNDERIQKVATNANRRKNLEALLDKYIHEANSVTNGNLVFSIGKIVAALKSMSTFEFTDELEAKDENKKKGFSKENLEQIEKELGLL